MKSQFLPPPERCESTADLVARCGGSFETCAPGEQQGYALPPQASEELRDFWRGETRAEIGAGFVARLAGASVFGAGAVLAPDGKSVARDVSLDFGKAPNDHWLLRYQELREPQELAGTSAVIATALGDRYAHWLLDELPRLLTLSAGAADRLIAHTNFTFARDAIVRRGWSLESVVVPKRTSHLRCEQLVVPSLSGGVIAPSRRGVELLRDFTSEWPAVSKSPLGEKLFISREHASRRRVANEAELWRELESEGFARIALENLSWPEQIAVFRQARVIVAPHGAGLANLIFCRRGTRVVEIFNRAYVHGCFWRLAALQDLDYRPVVSAGEEPLGQSPGCNRLDVTADVAAVRAALRDA